MEHLVDDTKVSSRYKKARLAYRFLKDRAESMKPFTYQDIMLATGWKQRTVKSYMSKLWQEWLVKRDGQFVVSYDFLRVSWGEFCALFSQKRSVYGKYRRVKYDEVITYEFLLPLTREDRLRRALDYLFYSDTVKQRLREVGVANITTVIPRRENESDEEYVGRICGIVSEKFGGYSIGHVNGRFRVGNLISREVAGKMLASDDRYLVDETTAVVKFIIPCNTTRVEQNGDFESLIKIIGEEKDSAVSKDLDYEIRLIRFLFFILFVEAVVRTIDGEDEIWLLESGISRRLYVWEANRN